MLLACGVMSSQYFAWWMFATPDEKAWIRRVLIGVVFLLLGLGRVLVMGITEARGIKGAGTRGHVGVAVAVGAVLISGSLLHNARLVVDRPTLEFDAANAAASWIREQPPSSRFFGFGWWSAPVLSTYSGRDFLDLDTFDVCDLRATGDYLVLDRYVTKIAFPDPPFDHLRVVGIDSVEFGDDTSIWQIVPAVEC
jgi:hypothetical protein